MIIYAEEWEEKTEVWTPIIVTAARDGKPTEHAVVVRGEFGATERFTIRLTADQAALLLAELSRALQGK